MPPYQPKAGKAEINKCLLVTKKAITAKNFDFMENRPKNMQTLSDLGLLTENVYDIIRDLTYKNYLNGPTDDRDIAADTKTIWEFGYELDATSIYIKIKIMTDSDKIIGISFHKAERPLYYHFK